MGGWLAAGLVQKTWRESVGHEIDRSQSAIQLLGREVSHTVQAGPTPPEPGPVGARAGWPGFSPVLVLHFPRCLCGCGCQASQSKPRFVACGPCYGGSLGSLPGISLKEQTLNKRRRMADGSEAVQLMGVIVVGHRQGLKQGSPQRADQGPKQRGLV